MLSPGAPEFGNLKPSDYHLLFKEVNRRRFGVMDKDKTYADFEPGSDDLVNRLVMDHQGWAASIARSVARAWNLDWQIDGLDGGAYEGLLFCARRYDPAIGVPFRAYARRRIHEASTQQARESKAWQRSVGSGGDAEHEARELSSRLLEIYPEIRDGLLPMPSDIEGNTEEALRASIRQLLASASLLNSFNDSNTQNPEFALEIKRLLGFISELDSVHQAILWQVYWQGQSMRSLATTWGIDELAVIREHKAIVQWISSRVSQQKGRTTKKLKIRPGLRSVAQKLRKEDFTPPFVDFETSSTAAVCLLLTLCANLFGL